MDEFTVRHWLEENGYMAGKNGSYRGTADGVRISLNVLAEVLVIKTRTTELYGRYRSNLYWERLSELRMGVGRKEGDSPIRHALVGKTFTVFATDPAQNMAET